MSLVSRRNPIILCQIERAWEKLNTFFLDALQQYGYPVLWLIVFLAAAGLPISGSLLLFASGAFAAFGDFSLFLLFPVALSAAVMGDNLSYFIGRRVGVPLIDWLEHQKRFRFITPEAIERGRAYFRQKAAWTIFTTRFLIVALGGSINLVAGLEQYPYSRFLLWDIAGQILGAIIPLGLGYIFAQSWEEVAGIFGAVSSLVLALLVAIILFIFLLQKVKKNHQRKQSIHTTFTRVQKRHTTLPLPEPILLQSTTTPYESDSSLISD